MMLMLMTRTGARPASKRWSAPSMFTAKPFGILYMSFRRRWRTPSRRRLPCGQRNRAGGQRRNAPIRSKSAGRPACADRRRRDERGLGTHGKSANNSHEATRTTATNGHCCASDGHGTGGAAARRQRFGVSSRRPVFRLLYAAYGKQTAVIRKGGVQRMELRNRHGQIPVEICIY